MCNFPSTSYYIFFFLIPENYKFSRKIAKTVEAFLSMANLNSDKKAPSILHKLVSTVPLILSTKYY